ncbi:Hint domain-containing protein [Mesorhizobium sp. M0633]|uniref:Hint domain-containing protein n=1 Tax=Mesorhizobium sp. M0633 TaxID=2956977 RepID=UPI00333808E7
MSSTMEVPLYEDSGKGKFTVRITDPLVGRAEWSVVSGKSPFQDGTATGYAIERNGNIELRDLVVSQPLFIINGANFNDPPGKVYSGECILCEGVGNGWSSVKPGKSGSRCFVSGTLVTMADGSNKPIEEIRAGDFILACLGGAFEKPEPIRVERLTSERSADTFVLRLSNGDTLHLSGRQKLQTTAGLVRASELRIGAPLIAWRGAPIIVLEIVEHDQTENVHFLHLAGDSYFLVGKIAPIFVTGDRKKKL